MLCGCAVVSAAGLAYLKDSGVATVRPSFLLLDKLTLSSAAWYGLGACTLVWGVGGHVYAML